MIVLAAREMAPLLRRQMRTLGGKNSDFSLFNTIGFWAFRKAFFFIATQRTLLLAKQDIHYLQYYLQYITYTTLLP